MTSLLEKAFEVASKFPTLEPIAKLPVAVEPKPGEGRELLFLAPYSVRQVIFHYGGMGLSGFQAIGRPRRMASTY
jgi:hypothetical protein